MKKTTVVMIVLAIALLLFIPDSFAGSGGDNLSWTLSDHVLTISGTGPMYDFGISMNQPPWESYDHHYIYHVIVEDGVTSIGNHAFGWQMALKSARLPDSVTSINEAAFIDCYDLSEINLPKGLQKLGDCVFANCGELKSIVIPDGIKVIPLEAFYWCDNLRTVTIPAGVRHIERSAFYWCDSLTDVYYGGTSEQWKLIAIDDDNEWLTNARIHYAGIEAFVKRCYNIILGREPDAGGLQTWSDELTSRRKAASEIIDRFVNSPEFQGKHYSNEETVEILYRAMMGRNSDPAGKARWVAKLDNGQPLAVVINGFCISKEFGGICASCGITPGSVYVDEGVVQYINIKAFVKRCYNIILGREADNSGLTTWYNELASKRKAASEIIDRFVNSPEFQGKHYSNGDAVEILYQAMLGRNSDPAGKANWVSKLDAGKPFAVVINGFCNSKEFRGICESYGIEPGSVRVDEALSGLGEAVAAVMTEEVVVPEEKKEPQPAPVEIVLPSETEDASLGTAVQAVYVSEEKAKEFISRCYRYILGREPGKDELDSWAAQMVSGQKTPDQIARGFLFSAEFKNRNVGNEDLVKILYRVYMNRDADPEGLKTWTEKLDSGTGLNALLDVFSKTGEFRAIVNAMGN